MFKYIAKQLEPGTEDFGYVFDDDGLNPSSGDENNTLFIFSGNDCRYNKDIYSDYEYAINGLVDDLDYISDYDSEASFDEYPDFVRDELGFTPDSRTFELLDACVGSAYDNDYPEALSCYLELVTGKVWDTRSFTGYVQGSYCTLVYCKERYTEESINYYGNMWLGCGGEFAIGELEIPNVYADEIDFSDLDSFESWIKDWLYGCFVIDDIIWRGGNKLISEVSDCFDVPESELEVYVYKNDSYVNAKDM